MSRHLHIVSPDIPFPPDYGGMIDVFYMLPYLQERGIQVHLHCFYNKRQPADELEKFCRSVQYYKRNKLGIASRLPYIVQSRSSQQLVQYLNKDQHPVLLQGIHCSLPLWHAQLKNRRVLLRPFNNEAMYYAKLANLEKNKLLKAYFNREEKRLIAYQEKIAKLAPMAALSWADTAFFKSLQANCSWVPPIIPYQAVGSEMGTGEYCLYHGNLSINENEEAAIWLIENVFADQKFPFKIAGKNPGKRLLKLANKFNIAVEANPTTEYLQQLIHDAHINVLPSFNATGIKLKLINALYNGRYCIVNPAAIEGSGLESVCNVAENTEAWKKLVASIFKRSFGQQEITHRTEILRDCYNNQANVDKIIAYLY